MQTLTDGRTDGQRAYIALTESHAVKVLVHLNDSALPMVRIRTSESVAYCSTTLYIRRRCVTPLTHLFKWS